MCAGRMDQDGGEWWFTAKREAAAATACERHSCWGFGSMLVNTFKLLKLVMRPVSHSHI